MGLPVVLILSQGCSRLHPEHHENIYVAARQVYLHDRVAAVSNRVGVVTNGESLEVLERGRRFYKVRTPKGEVGWLEEHAVIDDKAYAQFQELNKKHANDPVVATGQLRDDLYLHVVPGRDAPHFWLIAGNTKVGLLSRGIIEKKAAPGLLPKTPATVAGAKANSSGSKTGPATVAPQPQSPALAPATPPAMEDWWLVRDNAGHTGWLLAGRLDVDVPEEIGVYAEEQRMVAAYPLTKVIDNGAGSRRKDGKSEASSKPGKPAAEKNAEPPPAEPENKEFTEYVSVLSPPKNGLPYDFDQVRVFTWSLNHHRYETAFRVRNIQGYLPVKITQETVNGQAMPVFSFEIASGPDVKIDPDTGITRPLNTRTLSFRLEGNLVRRTGADQAPITPTREGNALGKAKTAAKNKNKR